MRKFILCFFISLVALHAEPDANAILRAIDENLLSESKIVIAKMTVSTRRGERTMESKSWIAGNDNAFTEYLSPAREKGTKMLKLGDQLWTYSPSTDRTIKISGHMLRQSMMGSDMSYEDMMEDDRLAATYNATLAGEEELLGYPCWILQLESKTDDAAYHTRKIWAAKNEKLVLKEERYAKSGKLLKTLVVKKVEKLSGRWVATEATFKDQLKSGDGTTLFLQSIQYNAEIPDYIFSKAALKK